jgi:hypothetical protein
MATLDLGRLKIGIQVDNAEANKALQETKKISKSTGEGITTDWNKVASTLNTVGSNMTKYITVPLAAIGTACVKLASDMEETTNKISAVFGTNATEVSTWAEKSVESMGLAQQTALDMAATFGDMGTGMGMTTAEAAKMSMELVQLAADLASFKNISVERAQTALQGVYTGETEALKGLGVVMTEANLEQFAMNQGISTTYKEMSQTEKIMLRYKYVMNATSNAQGDFSKTSDGLANQSRMVKENLKELGVQFGQVLLPIVNKVITGINNLLKSFMGLDEGQRETIVTIAAVIAAVGPALLMVSKIITAINVVKTAITEANIAMTASSGIIGLIILAITALIALITSFAAAEREAAEAADERLNKSLDETQARLDKQREKTAELTSETNTLTGKLNELSETDPNVKINTNAEIVQPQVEELRTAIGNLLLGAVDLKKGVDDLNGSLDDYVNGLVEARKATTIDHIMNMVDAYHQGLISQEQFNQYVNESVTGFNNYKAVVGEAKDGFDGFISSLNNGGTISLETTNALLNGSSGLAEQGVSLGTQLNNAAEGMSNLTQASQEGIIATGGYNVVAQETAGLLAGEMVNAVSTITSAYDVYQQSVKNAYDDEKVMIEEKEAYKAALEEKYQALDVYNAYLLNGVSSTEALKNVELAYGTETAQSLKDSFNEKYGTLEVGYSDSISLANEWRHDITTCEEALNKDSGEIAQRRKDAIIGAEQQLATDINSTTTGWTNQQIDDFVKLAEQSGLALDQGFVDMLKSCNGFVEDSKNSFNQAGEFSAEAFKTGLDTVLPKLNEMKTTVDGDGKAIGKNLSSGIAVGIRNNKYEAINAAVSAVKDAITAAKKAGEIRSPSRKAAREIGKPFAQGIGVGFEDEIPTVLNKVKSGIGKLTVGVSSNDSKAAASAKIKSDNNLLNAIKSISNSNKANITQNNTFTSKELSPYEQQVQVKKLSRNLAEVFA